MLRILSLDDEPEMVQLMGLILEHKVETLRAP
jgi:hypothetical protein